MLPAVAAVIRAIARQNLVAAGGPARQLDRVLVRLGAAVGEEEHVDVAGAELGELPSEARARLGRHERVGVGERRRLLLDGANHALVAVTDVHAHQLTVEVDEALSLRRPEVDALGARDRNRIDLRLRRPLEQRVLLRERDDLVTGHGDLVFMSSASTARALFRLHVAGMPEISARTASQKRLTYFLSIASRLARNSLPGFHSGYRLACATR